VRYNDFQAMSLFLSLNIPARPQDERVLNALTALQHTHQNEFRYITVTVSAHPSDKRTLNATYPTLRGAVRYVGQSKIILVRRANGATRGQLPMHHVVRNYMVRADGFLSKG